MRIRSSVKSGRLAVNHSQTAPTAGIKIKTHVKSGQLALNHSHSRVNKLAPQTITRMVRQVLNHNQVVRSLA
jgi:hypothetical protein